MTPLGQSAFLFHLIPPLGRPAFEEHAQNGVRRDFVPNPLRGARRTLCAFEEHAQNGVQRELAPNPLGGARRTLCASNVACGSEVVAAAPPATPWYGIPEERGAER
jgi:hypothetical protein